MLPRQARLVIVVANDRLHFAAELERKTELHCAADEDSALLDDPRIAAEIVIAFDLSEVGLQGFKLSHLN